MSVKEMVVEGEKESEEKTDEGLRAFPLSQQRAFHRWSKNFQTPISALTRVTHHPTKETSGQLEQDTAGGHIYYSVKTLLLVQLAICSILHALLNRWFLCFL